MEETRGDRITGTAGLQADESDEVRLISENVTEFHTKVGEHTGTKDIRNAPGDRFNLAFLLMVFLGMSSSYAWNFFVTASDYFRYSFRNVTNPSVPTELQTVFENALAVTGTAIGLIGVFINTILTRYISFQKRIIVGFVIIVIVFIATTVLAEVDTDSWQSGFFGVTMLNIVVISFFSNAVAAALFGVQGCLPSRFATAIMVGQTFAGIVAAFAMIISVLSGREDAGDGKIKAEACGFFASAAVMSVIAVFGFLLFLRLDFVEFYLFPPPDEVTITDVVETGTAHEETVAVTKENFNVRLVFSRTWKHGLILILNFMVTLALFPAVATMVKSTNSSSGSLVNNQLFLPIACFLVLNCSDLAGRLAHGFLQWPTPDQGFLTIMFAVLRFGFIPLLMLCNAQPRSRLPVMFGDGAFAGILAGLVFTNGYLGNLGIMYGPKLVPPEFAETTGSLMGFCLSFGLFLGASISFALTASL